MQVSIISRICGISVDITKREEGNSCRSEVIEKVGKLKENRNSRKMTVRMSVREIELLRLRSIQLEEPILGVNEDMCNSEG
jgi:hypothetical protein